MPRTATAVTTALLLLVTATGCAAEGEQHPEPNAAASSSAGVEDTGMVAVETEIAALSRPEEWTPIQDGLEQDRVAAFAIPGENGVAVGQMDVLVNAVVPGTEADAVDAANQGARATNVRDLRHDRREFTDVPGAESAFLNESTYVTAEGEQARSVDLVAISAEGDYLLVRISSAEVAFDRVLFEQVLDSVEMTAEVTS